MYAIMDPHLESWPPPSQKSIALHEQADKSCKRPKYTIAFTIILAILYDVIATFALTVIASSSTSNMIFYIGRTLVPALITFAIAMLIPSSIYGVVLIIRMQKVQNGRTIMRWSLLLSLILALSADILLALSSEAHIGKLYWQLPLTLLAPYLTAGAVCGYIAERFFKQS